MKEQTMVQSPSFEVNLGGIDLSEKQAQELEKAIQQTTLQFLAKLDNGFTDGLLAYKPTDPMGTETGSKEFAFDKRWWFGYILWKQPKIGQELRLDLVKPKLPDGIKKVLVEKVQLRN